MDNLITIFVIVVTIVAYMVSRRIFIKTGNPLLNPVLLSTTVVITVLLLCEISYTHYQPAREIMTFLLGPATVALAIPLYRNRHTLRRTLGAVLLGVSVGTFSTIVAAVLASRLGGLDRVIVASIAPKSVTAPIAIEVSGIIGGDPALTAAFVVATGTLGSVIGPVFMTRMGITNPIARGLAMGTTSHGQGTAVILQEGELQGAMGGVAMALSAVLTSFIAPIMIPWLISL